MATPEAPSIMPAIGAVSPNPIMPCTKARRDSRPALTSRIRCRSSCSFIEWLQNDTLQRHLSQPFAAPGVERAAKVDQLNRGLSKQNPGQLWTKTARLWKIVRHRMPQINSAVWVLAFARPSPGRRRSRRLPASLALHPRKAHASAVGHAGGDESGGEACFALRHLLV